MTKQHKKPCKQCPYRRTSAPGYLGEHSHDPQAFLWGYFQHEKHPCHKHVNYDGFNVEKQIKEAPSCAGFAIMCKNMCKLPYNQESFRLIQQVEIDKETVFTNSYQFIDHHKPKED